MTSHPSRKTAERVRPRRRIVLATTLTVATCAGGIGLVSAASTAVETVFVPITPCRLIDTRPATDVNTGPRDTPIGDNDTVAFNAHDGNDANSPCAIPTTATAVAANAVAINPSARSYLTLYPGDVANPGTANLNFVAGQAPTPNAANIPLAADGSFNVFNAFGTVHVVIDINGYYQPSTNTSNSGGTQGPAGAAGPTGATGPAGPKGATGAPGPAGTSNRISDQQIATLAWHQDPGAEASIPAGVGPSGLATDGTYVYVTNLTSDDVSVIDPTTNSKIATIPVAARPNGIAFDGTNLYVANSGRNTVSVIDPTARTVVKSINVGLWPWGVAYTGTHVYVTNSTAATVSVIDPVTNTVVDTIGVGNRPQGIAYDGRHVYVSNNDAGTVSVIDPATRTIIETISVGTRPNGIAFDGNELYVANVGSANVSVIDPATRTVTDTIAVGNGPYEVAYDGANLYVTNFSSNSLSVIDPTSKRAELADT